MVLNFKLINKLILPYKSKESIHSCSNHKIADETHFFRETPQYFGI